MLMEVTKVNSEAAILLTAMQISEHQMKSKLSIKNEHIKALIHPLWY